MKTKKNNMNPKTSTSDKTDTIDKTNIDHKTIAVIYHSASGATHRLANAIQQGANTCRGVNVNVYRIQPEHIQDGRFIAKDIMLDLTEADGIIFGSPTYMGSVSAQFKAFADASSEIWSTGEWTNKIAAAFTIGSSYSGDQLSTIQYLQTLAAQHGMLWAGLDSKGLQARNTKNDSGAQSGLITYSADSEISNDALLTAQYLGERVASLASRL